jgi:hypothetical protein
MDMVFFGQLKNGERAWGKNLCNTLRFATRLMIDHNYRCLRLIVAIPSIAFAALQQIRIFALTHAL